jgi:hypothetical protein
MTVNYFVYKANGRYYHMITIDFDFPLDAFKASKVKGVQSGILLEAETDYEVINKKAVILHDFIEKANQNSNFNPRLLEELLK